MRLWEIPYRIFFKKRDQFQMIARILSDASNREMLMGVKRHPPMTPEQYAERVTSDVNHVVRHSETDDYAVWAKEAWAQFLFGLEKVLDEKTDPQKVEFYRGGMTKIIDLLAISYKVLDYKKDAPKRQFAKTI